MAATEIVNTHNAKTDKAFTMRVNKFADWSPEELDAFLAAKPQKTHEEREETYAPFSGELPTEVNWLKDGYVSQVKDQGKCGSCWAFSAVATLESKWAIVNGLKDNVLEFSEQQLVDCTKNSKYRCYGCRGGWPNNALEYVFDEGLETEDEYPYHARDETCKDDWSKEVVRVEHVTETPHFNATALKEWLTIQPISIAVMAGSPGWMYYDSGIVTSDCGSDLDHAVFLVGYGFDEELEMEYWLVKNSWGTEWGEDGYIRIKIDYGYTPGLCGVASMPVLPDRISAL